MTKLDESKIRTIVNRIFTNIKTELDKKQKAIEILSEEIVNVKKTSSKITVNGIKPDSDGNITIKTEEGTGESSIIDLEKYGIVQADYEYPFTTAQYEVAYANGLGFQKALDDAKEKGIKTLTIPDGNYPLCYATDDYQNANNILNASGVNLEGYGVKLYVIYDDLDTGLNPYYTGDASVAHAMCGVILETDSDVEGIEFVGERAYRTSDTAKYREFSAGIHLSKWANGNNIKNCKLHHFSGDGIGAGTPMQQIATWVSDSDSEATAITWDGTAWQPSTKAYTTMRHGIYFADITKPFQCRGSLYFIWTSEPLKIHCFKGVDNESGGYDEGDYIGTVKVKQGNPFYFLEGTKFWYLETTSGAEHSTDSTTKIGIALGYGTYCNTVIEGCESYANTRGGMSNLPSGSVVRNCTVHHNGCEYDGMLAFYDGTQFGIDIEDWYIDSITIENCNIYGNLHGILYRCNSINIIDSTVSGITKSLNYQVNFYAKNTKFLGSCEMTTPAEFGTKTAIGCTFSGNVSDAITIVDDTEKEVVSGEMNNETGILSFFNNSGRKVFEIDMSKVLGIVPKVTSEGKIIDLDFVGHADETTIENQGSLETTVTIGGTLTDDGLVQKAAYSSSFVINENPNLTDEMTVEIVSVGTPNVVLRDSDNVPQSIFSQYTSAGIGMPDATNVNGNYYGFNTKCYYTNTSGTSTSESIAFTNNKYIAEDGSEKNYNYINFPDDDFGYVVVTMVFNSDGVSAYVNGHPISSNPYVPTDFVTWDFSNISKLDGWRGALNTDRILKQLRVYNIALTENQIAANYKAIRATLG